MQESASRFITPRTPQARGPAIIATVGDCAPEKYRKKGISAA